MNLKFAKGKYLVAVSGGVDSVVLLHMLTDQFLSRAGYKFVVAHFDHGIRTDSADDAQFVRTLAKSYGIEFVNERSELGAGASEEMARNARYDFLRRTCKKLNLDLIVTAHHRDDLVETMFLQIMRGGGRYGLDPMVRTEDIVRPLINTPKSEILKYAKLHNLQWHEDSTNLDISHVRNALRKVLAQKLSPQNLKDIMNINKKAHVLNAEIDLLLGELDNFLLNKNGELVRNRIVTLPFVVSSEYMKKWLALSNVKDIDKKLVTRTVVAAKTLSVGKKIDCGGRHWLQSNKKTLKIIKK